MNKLIKSLLLGVCLTGSLWAEQKVVFISANYRISFDGGNLEFSTKELDNYLKKGWEIKLISGSGADSTLRVWAVVIEKNAPKTETKVEKKD